MSGNDSFICVHQNLTESSFRIRSYGEILLSMPREHACATPLRALLFPARLNCS